MCFGEGRRLVRSPSIFRCSRIPNHWQSGSTSAGPQAPTAVEVAAAAPTAAAVPRGPSPPDHPGLPDLASHGSDSSPSCRCCPSPGPSDHPGTSESWAQGPPGPRGRGRRAVRKPTMPTPRRAARSQTAEPTVSFALQSPSPKNFPETRIQASNDSKSSRAMGCRDVEPERDHVAVPLQIVGPNGRFARMLRAPGRRPGLRGCT